MEYKIQTLNKGEINVGFSNGEEIRIGNLVLPLSSLIRFMGELTRNPNSERSLPRENGEIKGRLEYNGVPDQTIPKILKLGEYEMNGGNLGKTIDRLMGIKE